MAKKKEDVDAPERRMLPLEFAREQGISNVVIAGAFQTKIGELITESEFEKSVQMFLDKQGTV